MSYVTTGNYCNDPLSITGPGALGKAINIALNRNKLDYHSIGTHNVSGYEYTLGILGDTCKIDENRSLLKLKYSDYSDELNSKAVDDLKFHYRKSWDLGHIYSHGKRIMPSNFIYKKELCIELAGWVRLLYKSNQKKKARSQIMMLIKKGRFSIRFLELIIVYDFVKPILKFCR